MEPLQQPFEPSGFQDFGFKEPDVRFKTRLENFNFDAGGQMTAPPKGAVPPGGTGSTPESINFDNTVRDYVLKQQQLNEAYKQQKAIDDLYQKVVGDALPTEVEVLPPDDFDLITKPPKNITPPEDLAEIIKLREQQFKKTQPPPRTPPPTPSTVDLAPPAGTPGAKPGYKTIPNEGTIPGQTHLRLAQSRLT